MLGRKGSWPGAEGQGGEGRLGKASVRLQLNSTQAEATHLLGKETEIKEEPAEERSSSEKTERRSGASIPPPPDLSAQQGERARSRSPRRAEKTRDEQISMSIPGQAHSLATRVSTGTFFQKPLIAQN